MTMHILVGFGVAGTALLLGGAAWLALYPWLPRDLGGVPNLDDRARRVRIPVGDHDRLDGWLLAGARPAIVLVLHGYGRDHARAWRYGRFLHAAGYGVLAIDFRSSRAFGSGTRLPTTLGAYEVPDAEAALAWIERELPGHTIAIFGESLGASVALVAASRHPRVAAVVADGAFASGLRVLEESSERWARVPRHPTVRFARSFGRAMTGHDPAALDVECAASGLCTRPVLFIHGDRDNRIGPDQVESLWRAAGAKDTLWRIPEAGHNQGWRLKGADYESRVLEFLERALADRVGPSEMPAS